MDRLIDVMIALETDPRRVAAMQILKVCRRIDLKTTDVLERYKKLTSGTPDLKEAQQTLEYLQMVNVGLESYLSQIGATNDESKQ